MATSNRLKPTSETIKQLLLRSGNECAFPDCPDVIFNDRNKLVGECCHIEAAKPGGQRYNPNQSSKGRRSYDNLLFLCHKHHVETNDTVIYTVDALKKIKTDHENRFREKPIAIKADYVIQVLSSLDEVLSVLKETSNEVKDISKKQDDIIGLLKSQEKNIDQEYEFSEFFGCPNMIFFKGRERELNELRAEFDKYNTFLITGISGIGKTSLTARFLSQLASHKTLWIDCEVVKTSETFFQHLGKFLKQEFKDNSVERVVSSSNISTIQRTVLFALQKNNCCIAFDGLNTNDHNLYQLLKTFNEFLKDSKIIVSTNFNWDIVTWKNPPCKISLSGLDKSSFNELLRAHNLPNLTDASSSRLFYLLNGHPYLLKLSVNILHNQPIERFISQLENQGFEEISEYIRLKTFEILSAEERALLKELSEFSIPFRFSFGDFISSPQSFKKLFKNLRDRFLIETFHESFFTIPEFIKTYIKSEDRADNKVRPYLTFTNYLLSLKSDTRFFEREALVYYALNAGLIDTAKQEAHRFLSALMGTGKFNLALQISTQLEREPRLMDWSPIYYVQGRVLRFQEDFENALRKYNQALTCCSDKEELKALKFEKASLLSYRSQELQDKKLLNQAIGIYGELAKSDNISISVQSQSALALIMLRSKKYTKAINLLENLLNTMDAKLVQVNVQASIWQILGDAYSKAKNYKKAFESFDRSCDLYKVAIDKFGMNIIDGLYHLYESYAWTYVKAGDYIGATQLFGLCVGLCSSFELGLKKEKALFDYGYHLILTQEYAEACNFLADHYSFIVNNNLIEETDMPLIHGTLAFANWYAGNFVEAVELIALLVISSYRKNLRPVIAIVEEEGMNDQIDALQYFQKRGFIFIIPLGKTHQSFGEWVSEVVSRRPELAEPLSNFAPLKRESV